MKNPPDALIFDLDGTLVDTAPDLAAAMNAVLKKAGRRPVPPAEVRRLVGRGARTLIERGFSATGAPVPAERLDFHVGEFLEHYGVHLSRHSRPFPGVDETLSLLSANATLGVCTNKPHDLSERLLEELSLAQHFTAVRGAGYAPYNKPDPRHIADVIAALGGTKERAVMIGDSITDVAAARAAGIPIILVSYGYTEDPVHTLGGDIVTDDFTTLPDLIAKLLEAA